MENSMINEIKEQIKDCEYYRDNIYTGPDSVDRFNNSIEILRRKERKINRILCGKTKRVIKQLPEEEKELHNEFFTLFLIEMKNELYKLNTK